MSGAGFGHGGPVGEILDALPLDTTWHVTDCGYDDNDERCGCYDLPSRLRKIVDAARADEFESGVRRAIEWLRADYPFGEGPEWRESGAEWIAERLAEWRHGRPSSPGEVER